MLKLFAGLPVDIHELFPAVLIAVMQPKLQVHAANVRTRLVNLAQLASIIVMPAGAIAAIQMACLLCEMHAAAA